MASSEGPPGVPLSSKMAHTSGSYGASPPSNGASPPVTRAESAEHPLVTRRERLGWFAYDWANSATSSVAISGFLPLLIQDLALAQAGFPGACLNVVRNATLVASAFGSGEAMYACNFPPNSGAILPSSKCTQLSFPWGSPAALVNGTWCPGEPPSAQECLAAGGDTREPIALRVESAGMSWDPSAYAAMVVAVSTALCMVGYVGIGAVAEFGANRKAILTLLTLLGSLASVLVIAVTKETWWGAGVLMVIITVTYNTSYVVYNAWLPLLAANDAGVAAMPPGAARDAAYARETDRLSSVGFASGYFGSVLCLLICVGITFALGGDTAYRVNVLVSGVWWLGFSCFTLAWVKPRPGAPLPQGESYLMLPWKRLWETLTHDVHHIPRTFTFLILFFFYSDGYNVISS